MAGITPALSPGPAPSKPLPSVDSGDEEPRGSAPSLPATPNGKRARIRLFPQKWLGDYPWLVYDAAEKTMHCRLCKELGKKTLMAMSGTKNFRTRTLTDHALSADHQHAMTATEHSQTWVDVALAKNSDSRRKAIALAMQTCYWVITQEVANCKYKAMVEFLQQQSLASALLLNRGANATYSSTVIFNELMECLSGVSEQQLKTELHQSAFIGIGIDESTDRATEKHLAVIARYVSRDAVCKTVFMDCVSVPDGKALTVVNAIKTVITKFGVDISKVVGLGSDGASAMASELNGVNGLLMQENPFLVFSHCVAHRLSLAVSQACAGITEMVALQHVMAATYNYVELSPTRLERFKEIATILALDIVKFKRLYEIR